MIDSLPIDRYYRGYRLSIFHEGEADMTITVYHGPDRIDTFHSTNKAKEQIDAWMVGDDRHTD